MKYSESIKSLWCSLERHIEIALLKTVCTDVKSNSFKFPYYSQNIIL